MVNTVNLGAPGGSYHRRVIALCEVDNSTATANSWTAGVISFLRNNGNNPSVIINYSCQNRYNAPRVWAQSLTGSAYVNTAIRFCTFTKNGQLYGGIEYYFEPPEHQQVVWRGNGTFKPLTWAHYNEQTASVTDAEINASIDYTAVDFSELLHWNNQAVWHAGNHNSSGDPHGQYRLESESIPQADIDGLDTALDGKVSKSGDLMAGPLDLSLASDQHWYGRRVATGSTSDTNYLLLARTIAFSNMRFYASIELSAWRVDRVGGGARFRIYLGKDNASTALSWVSVVSESLHKDINVELMDVTVGGVDYYALKVTDGVASYLSRYSRLTWEAGIHATIGTDFTSIQLFDHIARVTSVDSESALSISQTDNLVRTNGYLHWHAGNLTPISQAEAEAGSATTQRTWTAQRVRQAINARALVYNTDPITTTINDVNLAPGYHAVDFGATGVPVAESGILKVAINDGDTLGITQEYLVSDNVAVPETYVRITTGGGNWSAWDRVWNSRNHGDSGDPHDQYRMKSVSISWMPGDITYPGSFGIPYFNSSLGIPDISATVPWSWLSSVPANVTNAFDRTGDTATGFSQFSAGLGAANKWQLTADASTAYMEANTGGQYLAYNFTAKLWRFHVDGTPKLDINVNGAFAHGMTCSYRLNSVDAGGRLMLARANDNVFKWRWDVGGGTDDARQRLIDDVRGHVIEENYGTAIHEWYRPYLPAQTVSQRPNVYVDPANGRMHRATVVDTIPESAAADIGALAFLAVIAVEYSAAINYGDILNASELYYCGLTGDGTNPMVVSIPGRPPAGSTWKALGRINASVVNRRATLFQRVT